MVEFLIDRTTLEQCPPLKAGDLVPCARCSEEHEVYLSENPDGTPGTILYYKCGGHVMLAGLDGKDVREVENVRRL